MVKEPLAHYKSFFLESLVYSKSKDWIVSISLVMGRVMKGIFKTAMTKGLIFAIAIVLTASLMGCHDPIVADMETQHRELGNVVKQEIQRCRAAFPSGSQTETLFPAP